MARRKSNPDVIFKVRNPATGLFLKRKSNTYTRDSWDEVGAVYPTEDRARKAAEHFILQGPDLPLEVVELLVREQSVTPVMLPPLDRARSIIGELERDTYRDDAKALWYVLSGETFGRFLFNRICGGGTYPKWFVWVRGWTKAVEELNLAGSAEKGKKFGHKRTLLGLDDDAALVAVKVLHHDEIVQIFDQDGNLHEGQRYAT